MHIVSKSAVLSAGRPTPQSGESMQREKGVALVFSGPAIAAWKTGSEQCNTWVSRIVRATLSSGKRSGQLHVL